MLQYPLVVLILANLAAGKFYIIETKDKPASVKGVKDHNSAPADKHTVEKEYGSDYMDDEHGSDYSAGWGQTQTTTTAQPAWTEAPCVFETWSNWKNTADCGQTVKSRSRHCTRNNVRIDDCSTCQSGPYGVQEKTSEVLPITLSACCIWSAWGEWSPRGDECVESKVSRSRKCEPTGGHTGNCIESDCGREQSVEYNTYPAVDCCQWTAWANWGSCSKTCGEDGTQHKSRSCKHRDGSTACSTCTGTGSETVACPTNVPCIVSTVPPPAPTPSGGWGRRRRRRH